MGKSVVKKKLCSGVRIHQHVMLMVNYAVNLKGVNGVQTVISAQSMTHNVV